MKSRVRRYYFIGLRRRIDMTCLTVLLRRRVIKVWARGAQCSMRVIMKIVLDVLVVLAIRSILLVAGVTGPLNRMRHLVVRVVSVGLMRLLLRA